VYAAGRINQNRYIVVLLVESDPPRAIEVKSAVTPNGELQTYTALMLN